MTRRMRSGCPINRSVEVFGDPWSLLVIRDVMFGSRRTFGALLSESEEGISSSVLASRLERLVAQGLLSRSEDPGHAQRVIYSLTESAIQLLPVFVQIGAWGRRHLDDLTPELTVRAALLEEGGPLLWEAFMDELRSIHLGRPRSPGGASVLSRLDEAFEEASAGRRHAGS
ncbi:MAG TPA: helix-turn-helix domain-containing protein [Longimicrobiales bacterium]|nr:helix-turn-helix domain-containing protein [Longimicrobiales bacterium]